MPTISGAHVIIFSSDAEADRQFLRDVLELNGVDAGDGWLIFALPPTEVAVHPGASNDVHELYLTCDDVKSLVKTLKSRKIRCSAIEEQGWGQLTRVTLPGGGKLGIYQPSHPMAHRSRRNQAKKRAARA